MKYKGTYFDMWDAWYMKANGKIHGFHLKSHPGDNWNVGHVVTDDLLHFKTCRDILTPFSEETHPDDCKGKYTGSAYYDEKSGTAYVYYTMRDGNASEKIGLATSTDLVNFKEYEGNPVLTINEDLFIKDSKQSGATDCRDMFVLYDEASRLYFGYFAAMTEIDGRRVGAIGMAKSPDLINWGEQSIVYTPSFGGVIEMPEVFKMGDKWYLTFLTGTGYGAKGAVDDPNLVKFTLYASSDSPLGPFVEEPGNLLIGGPSNSGYSCRTVLLGEKRYLMYIDKSDYGAAISLPKELRVCDGLLRPYYTDILKKIRTGKALAPTSTDLEAVKTSFAWPTFDEGLTDSEGALKVEMNARSYETYICKDFESCSIECEAEIDADCREAGLALETYDCSGNRVGCYTVSLNFDFGELTVYREDDVAHPYSPHAKCLFSFERGEIYHTRVIAMEGQIEVYINNVLVLQGNMQTADKIKPGIFCGNGSATFKSVKFYELEK